MAIKYLDSSKPNKPKITYTSGKQPIDVQKRLLTNTDKVENRIANRESLINLDRPINVESVKKNPLVESLRALGGGLEVAEGIPADIGLGLQRGVETSGKSLSKIPSDIKETLMGRRPAQFGDIFRGAGVSEPLSATGGLLASAAGATPSGELGNLIGRSIGKPLGIIGKSIKPGTANILSFLSGVPRKSTKAALDNPNLLSNKYIKEFGERAGQEIEAAKRPLIDDPNAIVTATPKMTSIGQDLKWYTPQGHYTAEFSAMTKKEQDNLVEWANRIDNGQGGLNYNEADKVIAEIDRELGSFYKGMKRDLPPITEQFDRQAKHIRDVISEARNSQFPQAGEKIKQYAKFAGERSAHRDFQRIRPRLMEGAIGGIGSVGLGLLLKSLPLAAGAFSLTSPAVQGQLIKGAYHVGKNIASSPALSPITMKAVTQRRKKYG